MENETKEQQAPGTAPKEKKKTDIVWIFDILGTVVALIAAFISLVTLFEMKVQRNNAYMPTIVFESTKESTVLGSDEQENNYDNITFLTRNIGVGVAKNITFTLDVSNLIRWIEFYNTMNPENPYPYNMKDDNIFQVTIDGQKIGFEADHKSERLFLLPNAQESYEFVLPAHYTIMLYEIYKHADTRKLDIPDLEVEVSYSDVQNVQYKETIRLAVNTFFFSKSESEMSVFFEIYMK